MTESITVSSDLEVTPVPILRSVGHRHVATLTETMLGEVSKEMEDFIAKAEPGDGLTLTLTTKNGNHVHVSEMVLDNIPDDSPDLPKVTVKSLGDDGELIERPLDYMFAPVPRATVRGVEFETSTPSYATDLYNKLSQGFHFNEKLYNIEFEKDKD